MDIQELRREAQTMQPQLTADRRRLHRNPEAGAVLPETVAYVKERLTEMGYHPQELGGGLTGPHGISDLGYGFVPENFNAYVVDNVVAVNTTDAQRAAQKVLRTDAIPASVASGAVLQAAAQLIHVGASRSALAILPGRQIVNTL